jgi:hypothetical protein
LALRKVPGSAPKIQNVEPKSSSYDSIKSIRKGMLDAAGLYGGTSSIAPRISSFRPLMAKQGGAAPYEKNLS